MNDAERLRIWTGISQHVQTLHPPSRDVIDAIRERSWHPPQGEAAQSLFLRALIGLPQAEVPHEFLVRIVRAFLHPTRNKHGVSPQVMKLIEDLPGFSRNTLIDALQWVGKRDTLVSLAELPTTEAIRELARATQLLRGYGAYSFLESLGLSAVAPEPCHRLVLSRLGMIPDLEGDDSDSVFAALHRLSTLACVPIREVAFVLSMFAGGKGEEAREVARCLPTPHCGQCPVAAACSYPGRAPGADGQTALDPVPPSQGGRYTSASDEEVLSWALGLEGPGLPPSVRALLRGPRRVQSIIGVTAAQLEAPGDCGPEIIGRLVALGELLARARAYIPPPDARPIRRSQQIWERYAARFRGLGHEELHVVHLDTGMRIIREVVVSVGGLRECLANPQDIFHEAIKDKAFGIIMIHNHPSGSCAPSTKDALLTSRISRSGKILGIPLLDHVVFGSASHFSFREAGLLHELETDEEGALEHLGGEQGERTD